MSFSSPQPPGSPPFISLFAQASANDPALSRLRTASVITLVGGCLLLLFSFFFAVFTAVLASSLGGALWIMIFGVAPAFVILAAGAKMMSSAGASDTWASVATVAAAISLLSFGGFLVGALLTFIGAALARSAARSLPAGASVAAPAYGAFVPPRQAYAPQQPYAPPAPPPLPYGPPMPAARAAGPMAPPYGSPAAYPLPASLPPPPPSPNFEVLALQAQALELFRRGISVPEIAVQLNISQKTAAWLVANPPAPTWLAPKAAPTSDRPLPPPLPQEPPESSAAGLATSSPAPASSTRPHHPKAPTHPADRFLQMDGNRAFDLEALNSLDFAPIRVRASTSRETADAFLKKSDELIARLRQDLGDINTIDDILRDRVVVWYTQSPTQPKWPHPDVPPWSGLVAESHQSGGARTPSLINRLLALRTDITPPPLRPVRNFLQSLREEGPEKPPSEDASLAAHVVQSVLDDIADTPRLGGKSLPLHTLSELANEVTPAAVNRALADLFKGDPKGPATIVHPARYPGLEFVFIRLPPGGSSGASVTYELVCAPPGALPGQSGASPAPANFGQGQAYAPADTSTDLSGNLWERDAIAPALWTQILMEIERRRDRLAPPPPNYRKLPAYFDLRSLLLESPDARRTFLAVKWRGKPPALPLLAALLTDRKLTPDVDTDCQYLEAELGDIARGDPNFAPADAKWTLPGGASVARSAAGGLRTYTVS